MLKRRNFKQSVGQKCPSFNINNTATFKTRMNNYYTYAYLREDGTPYYIGKGKGSRIRSKHRKNVKVPPKERRLFLKQNLTEEGAFKHEIYMISVFGRKDNGTGILINRTDGGEGSSGRIMPEEEKIHLSKVMKRYTEEEIKKKASDYYIKNKERISKYYAEKWKKLKESPEEMEKHRLKLRKPKETQKRNKLWKTWRITFDDGRVEIRTGLYSWCKENGYNDGLIYQVAKGTRNHHKDIVAVEELDHTPLD